MSKISLDYLVEMFSNMKSQTGWNVEGDMLWGYFFTDPEPEKLFPIAKYSAERGYRVVNIYETDDKKTHFLHVERVEKHTPMSLHERNNSFELLAQEYGIESYDGMDVGPVA